MFLSRLDRLQPNWSFYNPSLMHFSGFLFHQTPFPGSQAPVPSYAHFLLCSPPLLFPPLCCRHHAFFQFLKHSTLIGTSELLLILTTLPEMLFLPLCMGLSGSLPSSGSLLTHCLLREALLTMTPCFSVTASFIVLPTISGMLVPLGLSDPTWMCAFGFD